ncbi:MAG: hypothetical protein WCS37_16810 [Chloroflexota bacterium]|nr:hypothetical protein [Chloroflexota bacterium]
MSNLFDVGDVSRLGLDNGNWVEVADVKTVKAHEDYLKILTGGKIKPGETLEFDATASARAKVQTRVTGWFLSGLKKDGQITTLPFAVVNVAKFTEPLLIKVSAFIDELDTPILGTTGQADPNSLELPAGPPSGGTQSQEATLPQG